MEVFKNNWSACKNVLVIRADNMGDLLLSSPAIRALKQSLGCKITVLTSSMAKGITPMLPEIDEVICADVPWVKLTEKTEPASFLTLSSLLQSYSFDGCVVFTVYSQNPIPAILLAYLSAIPLRLAYCRENPYDLLTNWIPDPEPYEIIKHQVRRDLDLVGSIGAQTLEQHIKIKVPVTAFASACAKIASLGLNIEKAGYFILHPGVSEVKRQYPQERWVKFAQLLSKQFNLPILITGAAAEREIAAAIAEKAGIPVAIAGLLSLEEFAAVIENARAVVSVNTGTVHIAAALQTPVVVLHAQTNPQHSPWMVPHQLLEYSIPENLKSKNEVVKWVGQQLYSNHLSYPEPSEILAALRIIV